jgi:GntP family gluconate:H+ symporter
MNSLLVFVIVIISISVIGFRYRVPPFMTLIGGAVAFGFAVGGSPDTVFTQVTMGCAGVFNSLGIPILAGSVIAKYLIEQGYIQQIVSDIRYVLKNPSSLAGFAGYLIAVPSTCPITAYMMLSPVLSHLAPEGKRRAALMYLVALGSTIGVAFVYPTPVTFPLFDNFAPKDLSPFTFDMVAIPLSLIFLSALILLVRRKTKEPEFSGPEHIEQKKNEIETGIIPEPHSPDDKGPVWGFEKEKYAEHSVQVSPDCNDETVKCTKRFHPLAWAPFLVIFAAIPLGLFVLHLSHFSLVQFIMFAGMVAAMMTALPENRWTGFVSGAKHAGVIIFDICGAGALGYVITQSSFTTESLEFLAYNLPLILIPFVLAALIQTAQGSRIVTSILTAQIIATTAIPGMMNPLALFLMIIAGAGIICFVTDPYFWMLHRTTGDDVKTVFKNYTVPQILIGIITYLIAFTIQYFWP